MRRATRLRRGLLSWLTNAATPVFVLDERRVVLFFNRGCELLTGWTAAEVIGRVCEYSARGNADAVETLTDRLCPPPTVVPEWPAHVPVELLHRDGTSHRRTIHYFVLRESADLAGHIIGIIGPREPDRSGGDEAASARRHAALAEHCSALRRSHGEHVLIGASSAARRLREQLRVAAGCSASVHLHGERGSGREQLARLIHAHSSRSARAFVPLDCLRVAPIELKLTLRRLLSAAEQPAEESFRAGAVFLQSAGSLPRDVQELLVTQSEARAAAGWQLISADERRLSDLVAAGNLLPEYVDLVSEVTIEVPSLRARRGDIPLIAQHLLEVRNCGDSRQVGGFTAQVWEQFAAYDWPGNLAELEAVVGEARAASAAPLIGIRDLPFRFRTGLDAQAVGPRLAAEPVSLEALLAATETAYIRWALAAAKSNKSQAAALLGLTRPRLYRRMETLGIVDEDGAP